MLTTADGRKLTYTRLGSGPMLVCHPGGPGFSARYFSNLGGLDSELELVLLNPRGTGGSDPARTPSAYTIDDYAEDVEELRDHLGVERMWLLGHSHGGVVATAYAARYPERVERLILASTLVRHGSEQDAAMHAAIEARAGEPWYEEGRAALETELQGNFSDGRELMELVLAMMPFYFASYGDAERAYIQSLADEEACMDATRLWEREIWEHLDLRPLVPRVTMPTLVITGEEDFITGPVCADEIAAGIPNGEKVILPGIGHFLFVEGPGAWRDAVLSFLGVTAAA